MTALESVRALADSGQFSAARARINALLDGSKMGQWHRALAFEAERMRRIEMEFDLDQGELEESLRSHFPGATEEDFRQWRAQKLLEYREINGERRYFRKTAYNLVQLSDQAAQLSKNYSRFAGKAPFYAPHPHLRKVIRAKQPLRNRIRVRYRLSVAADAVPAGETLRAWLPFPVYLENVQENISLLRSSPREYRLAPQSQPQRTIYLEKTAQPGKATEFEVVYEFDALSRYTAIDSHQVRRPEDPEKFEAYLTERPPHIRFSPALRALSRRIVGDSSNPYQVAQKLFAHVAAIPWAGAREYSTIRNISRYAANAGHADCGQKTLLLVTLLRMNGIPARWQSGWQFSPGGWNGMHDWGEFYLAPYGWLPMDPDHGLLEGGSETERWFYLGGMDAFRLIYNTDYSRPFFPEKQHFRSETVDSQRGEVEWRGGNLYFDQWEYEMNWELAGKH